MSKANVKIFGASGCGNVGDDLIAYILKKYMQNHFQDQADVSLIPQQKQYEEIKTADILVIGGGGLIYDYDINNVKNYCDAINYAHSYRVPVYFMGMGVQHVFSEEAKTLYKEALPKVQAIATRGTYDSHFISEDLAYNPNKIVTSRDVVFLYDDVVDTRPSCQLNTSRKKPVLALSLADWKLGKNYQNIQQDLAREYKQYREYIDTKLPSLKKKFDIKIVCQAKEDVKISQYLAQFFGTEMLTFESPEESVRLIDIYREADLVITNRYHGLIAAIIAHTPALGVSFSTHKSQRLIDDSFPSIKSQSYTVGDFVKDDILSKVTDTTYRRSLRLPLESEYDACIRRAREHIEIIKYIANDIAKQ